MSMAKGTPWLFLIRGTSEIWGCGFFSTFDFMPVGVAWDTFGKANGFDEFAPFLAKIARLRRKPAHAVGSIGCAVLSEVEYFDTPIDYARYGRMYGPIASVDVRTRDGAELRQQMAARVQRNAEASAIIKGGTGKPVLVIPRRGQATFRIELERQYQMRCAELVLQMWCDTVIENWRRLAPIAAISRRRLGDLLWENFENLTVLSEDWMAAHPKGTYPAGLRRIDLKDEWLDADKQYAASLAPA